MFIIQNLILGPVGPQNGPICMANCFKIKWRMEMGNVSKRLQPDQIKTTAEGHQQVFNVLVIFFARYFSEYLNYIVCKAIFKQILSLLIFFVDIIPFGGSETYDENGTRLFIFRCTFDQ